jgi:hypothetical protein
MREGGEASARRRLSPRATDALAVVPITVTDRTCALVLGLEPRVYRALVVRERIPHARLGRRMVARIEDILAVFDRLAHGTTSPDLPEDQTSQPDTADAVLAILGKERRR